MMSGHAFLNGQDCNKFPLEAKKHVSYVSENVQLYGMFTARQNLRFFAELGGKKGLENKELDNVMRLVGLPEKALTMRLKNYSKGMRQKLGIAIALIKDPPAIVMDEPTSGLDPKSANEFLEQSRKLRERGKAILMTTHDIFRAKQIADRVGIMKQGRLVAVRERADFRHADLEEIYLTEMEAAENAP
jgi:ABC-2 type transport system ATP-binding protein